MNRAITATGASRRPSPPKLKDSTVRKMASPGQIAIHGAFTRKRCAALSILPHDGAGGCSFSSSPRRRRMGRVAPDRQHRGLYRVVLSRGRLSDMANLSWAKDAALAASKVRTEWET